MSCWGCSSGWVRVPGKSTAARLATQANVVRLPCMYAHGLHLAPGAIQILLGFDNEVADAVLALTALGDFETARELLRRELDKEARNDHDHEET